VALPPRIPGRPGSQRPGSPPTVDDNIASKRASEQLADECGQTEEDLEALKARYEAYFLGLERREPSRERWEMKRRVEKLKESFTKNTGLKFRLQTLHARFLSYERLWARSAREKEAGTYRRDLFKARLHRKPEETPAQGTAAPAASPAGAPAKAPVSPAARPAAAAPAGPASFSGTSEPDLRALYSAYVDAKKRCKEDVSKLSYDSLAKSVQKQVPELMARFKARSIEFRIEVKDGKAVLKAVPRV
jgi:hypothetical protein